MLKEGIGDDIYHTHYRNLSDGRWWSPDPKPNVSVSSYASMELNPIKFIDPMGDTVKIQFTTGSWITFNKKTHTVIYNCGEIYNEDGSKYDGKRSWFLNKTVENLQIIETTAIGSKAIENLENSINVFTIKYGYNNSFTIPDENIQKANAISYLFNNYTEGMQSLTEMSSIYGKDLKGGSGGVITFNPKGSKSLPEVGGASKFRAYISLGHEIFHADDSNNGFYGTDAKFLGINKAEWQAVYRENLMRLEMGIPLRTHYKVDEKTSKGRWPSTLIEDKYPIRPPWFYIY